ncbi:hypothetical protein V2J09_021231 [Rumex salicifolius]
MEPMSPTSVPWDSVLELTKAAQDRNTDPFLWSMKLGSCLNTAGVTLPSSDLARLLVSHICWDNNVPPAWKFLEKAVSDKLVPPFLTLALLSVRVIPARLHHPTAYRLYMELLKRHGFCFTLQTHQSTYQEVLHSIDDVLHLSQIFGIQCAEPGILVVLLVFSIVWQLLDASLDDEGLLEYFSDKKSRWPTRLHDMDIDGSKSFGESRTHHEEMHRMNTVLAVEIIGDFLQNKVTSRILYLARRNMPSDWSCFVQRLQLLASKSSVIMNSKSMTPDAFMQLTSDTCRVLPRECKTSVQQEFHAVMASGSLIPSVGQLHGASRSALWIPIDLFLEDSMDGLIATETSAVDTLTDLIKSLQALNGTTWHDTFLALWIAALRLVQRERNPSEGPVPRLDTCLCLLLSITILSVANVVEEEEASKEPECFSGTVDKPVVGRRRSELISSLQILGDHQGLLTPPVSIIPAVNQAAAKAMVFLSGISNGSGYLDCASIDEMPVNFSGNMLHLIVEACIARDLIDTSAYMWPGYVSARSGQIPHNVAGQIPGWSSLMKGASLTTPMVTALVSTPASSLAEIEKIFEIAVGGSTEEKMYAATVLCGASLVRGWNLQEHVVLFIMRLLTPPHSEEYSGSDMSLMNHASVLNILLVGISTVDCIQIFSLHGLVPQLAAALMPICEVFGSCSPKELWTLMTGEEINSHAVFSNAFTLLLKLWRFDQSPVEHLMGPVAPVGSQLTPEYLLMLRNAQLVSPENAAKNRSRNRRFPKLFGSSTEPIIMDSFPKLKRWYMQHQACIASTLSGLAPGNPVHEIVDGLSNMLFKKVSKGGQTMASGSTSSSCSAAEEEIIRLQLPAWDILEAVPFVLDAALTACAYDKLSPRELATGLKDLADFLPASLASILSFLAAEVSRGVWKPASMNGTDWPSPAANLSTVEQQLKKLLAATDIDVPSLATVRSGVPTLPLPLAALLSLTITYKLDKASERFLNLAGRAVIMLAIECPWPCMPIVASLWAQKVKRWSDFLVFCASRTVFHHNTDAVVQLLRSCFLTTLGLNPSPRLSSGGVGALLGHGYGSHQCGGISPVAPGIFFLRIYPFVKDMLFLTEEILSLLMMSVKEIACDRGGDGARPPHKSKYAMRYGQVSLAAAMTRVKLAASLGASLVWIGGGLSLVQALIRQTLPAWFISSDHGGGDSSEVVAMLRGYALAYFAVLCGTFAWGVDAVTAPSRRRPYVLGKHLKFMSMALDGKISLGCDLATWRAYVSGFVSLMVGCTPAWVREVDVDVLKSLSKGLRQWEEEELALALLATGGNQATAAAAELIIGGGM